MSQQINLFNPIFRQQKKYFSSITMAQALGVICIACAVLMADAATRLRSLKLQSAATDMTLVTKEAKLAQLQAQYPPRVRNAGLAAEIGLAQQELKMLQNASSTLAGGGFGDSRGFSQYFAALARQRVDGLWLTAVSVDDGGSRIGVQGNVLKAAMVPQYMARLAREPSMRGKAFATLDIGAPAVSAPTPGVATPALSYLQFSLQSTPAAVPVTGAPQ